MTAHPSSYAEYEALFMERSEVTGYGAGVEQHLPCPWCCEPDFMVLRIAGGIADTGKTVPEQMEQEGTCGYCERSGKSLVERTSSTTSFEFVQTGGPDPPDWLENPPRRWKEGDDAAVESG